ncbi:protein kinase domain-containing protein, partial [Streptomyces sp. SAS_260]|uniref:protein kinase domain-containing protein n=1 Tax=Streptomyces sp. SAS_260 TaxID=3412751 RepID=UPI00403CF6D7
MEELGAGDPIGVPPGVQRWGRIGAYRLVARLGAGGMGQVYLARSDRGRTVAVKLVREELAAQEEFRARFRQEVRAAQRVGGHWTAPVLDADTEAAVPWVATGYVAGPTLQQVVGHDHGALPERSVRILAAGLAHALQDIHAAGIVHRDLKPSNVLVTIDGPRVIDFGIARALETLAGDGLTRTGSLVGSPGFMAPEQVRGDRITPACDVFCLGSVLAYAATGTLPFGAANSGVHALMFRIAQEEPDLSGVPEGIADLVRDCLRKDPAARPTLHQILDRTGADDTVSDGRSHDPWLPNTLVAQLGRHAVKLLDTEDPETAELERVAPAATGSEGAAAEGTGSVRAASERPGSGGAGSGGAGVEGVGSVQAGSAGAGSERPGPEGASSGSAGVEGVGSVQAGSAGAASERPGSGGAGSEGAGVEGVGSERPGSDRPGSGSASPGQMSPEGQAPETRGPGEQDPDGQNPTVQSPAVQSPGVQDPGVQSPAVQSPGVQDPGVQSPAVQSPGVQDPGVQSPAVWSPGVQDPGGQNPGVQIPAVQNSAVQNSGAGNPGGQDPGVQNPAVQNSGAGTPAVQNPAVQNPAVQNSGAGTPGGQDPGVQNPGVQNSGDGTPGDGTPGDGTPGAETPAVRNPALRNPAAQGAAVEGGVPAVPSVPLATPVDLEKPEAPLRETPALSPGPASAPAPSSEASPEHAPASDDSSPTPTVPDNHLPTAVAGRAGASRVPNPPAPHPAYGYPQQHPQPAAYNPPPPARQLVGWGGQVPYNPYPHNHDVGLGPTPPYGPGPGGEPHAPPRNGRSTALLVVVALIVALGAGGSVYALMKDGGNGSRTKAGSGGGGATS